MFMSVAAEKQMPSPMRIFGALNGYQQTAALKAAIELDIFTAIAEGASTARQIAERTKSAERGVRILCDFLSVQNFLSKRDGNYSLSSDAATFLNRKSQTYLGGSIEFLLNSRTRGAFDVLTESVRKGGSALEHPSVEPENPMWVAFAHSMMPMMFPMAQGAASIVPLPDDRDSKILDIAASHGIFGISFAQHHKRAHIVGLDWKNVLELTVANAKNFGVADRYTTIVGDAFEQDFGSDYDLILVPNFLHHFDEPTCVKFLTKCAQALRPGGSVAIIEFVPNDDRVSPPASAAFSLTMLAGTPAGDAYTLNEYRQMLSKAGLQAPQAHALLPTEHQLILSRK
jgi:2-polyprenyl-3-methyl-5-hydroxy-6-metoxy-1,4-benzoquinol methylase